MHENWYMDIKIEVDQCVSVINIIVKQTIFISIKVWDKYVDTWSNICLIGVLQLYKIQGTWSITN